MYSERRSKPRLNTHLVVKITDNQENNNYYGYIENLSESGMGIATLETILTGTQISALFFVPGLPDKLTPLASLVHVSNGMEMLNYYGFKFNYVTVHDREAINKFINTN